MLSQFLLTFHQTQSRMPHFIAQLVAILEGTGAVFVIIWEMSHGRISLNSVLLVFLMNFVSGQRLESMYISLIVSIRSSLTISMVFSCFYCCHSSWKSLCLQQQNKSFESKIKFKQNSNHSKSVVEAAKVVFTNKTKESIVSQKLGSRVFW